MINFKNCYAMSDEYRKKLELVMFNVNAYYSFFAEKFDVDDYLDIDSEYAIQQKKELDDRNTERVKCLIYKICTKFYKS